MDENQEPEESRRSPLWYIIALFIVLLMTISIVPYYYIKQDPYPKAIPEIDDVVGKRFSIGINKTDNRADYNQFLRPNDPLVKQAATFIATYGCDSNKICQAKAEYYFVKDRFTYVSEYDEYIQTPQEMLATRGGDCDDHAVLLANLMRAIGIPTKFARAPRHVYIKIYLEDAPKKYKDEEDWIPLDPTCKHCEFGEIPAKYA